MKYRNRNLAILSDENIITVKVRFDDRPKEYAYLAHCSWGIEVGDFVLVPAVGSVVNSYIPAEVVAVDDEADIDVSQDIYYKFCNGKFEALATWNEEGLAEAEAEIQRSLNATLRKQLRTQLLIDAQEEIKNSLPEMV